MANNGNGSGNATDDVRFKHGLPTGATGIDKEDFARYILGFWKATGMRRSSLQSDLWDGFELYTLEDFEALSRNVKMEIRDHLRPNGVYVPRARL